MAVVTVSPDFRVQIPVEVRERLRIVPGQKLEAFAFGDRLELVPVGNPAQLRGMLKNIENDFQREPG